MFKQEIIDVSEVLSLTDDLKDTIYKNNCIIEEINKETGILEAKLIVKDRYTMDLVKIAKSRNMKFLGKTKEDYSLYLLKCKHIKEIKRSNFKNNSFKCRECEQESWKEEANHVGLEYIIHIDANRSLYRFNENSSKCDKRHIQIIGRKEVKKNSFKCIQCYNDNLKNIALEKNMEFLGVLKQGYGIYKLECGHYKIKHTGNLEREVNQGKKEEKCEVCREAELKEKTRERGYKLLDIQSGKNQDITIMCQKCDEIYVINEKKLDKFECSKCEDISYYKDINKLGLELIFRIDKYKKLFKVRECKHYNIVYNRQIIDRRALIKKNKIPEPYCSICNHEKLLKEAEDAGLEFLTKIGKDYSFYKIKECEHVQAIGRKEVRRKSFKCKTCKGIYLTDGIEVKSNYEKIVGNYILEMKYIYLYEKTLSTKSRHSCDFYFPDIDLYLEIAGYLNNKDDKGTNKRAQNYFKNLNDKIKKFYEDKNLLILYRDDFIDDTWKIKINKRLAID